MKTVDTLLVGLDYSHGKDKTVLIIGRKKKKEQFEVINAFQGKEALDIYEKLVNGPNVVKDESN